MLVAGLLPVWWVQVGSLLPVGPFFVSKIPLLEIIGSWHDNESISI